MNFLLHHLLYGSALRCPNKEAVVHGNQRLTYHAVESKVAGLADGMRNAGLRRGERVCVYLDAGIAQVVAIFGVSLAGGVFVPINTTLVPDQVVHIVRNSSASAIITTSSKLSSLLPALDGIACLRFLVIVSDEAMPAAPILTYDFASMTNAVPKAEMRDRGIGNDLARILSPTGTTGQA